MCTLGFRVQVSCESGVSLRTPGIHGHDKRRVGISTKDEVRDTVSTIFARGVLPKSLGFRVLFRGSSSCWVFGCIRFPGQAGENGSPQVSLNPTYTPYIIHSSSFHFLFLCPDMTPI